jgi:hypothetical protein
MRLCVRCAEAVWRKQMIDWSPAKFIPSPGIYSSECFARNYTDRTVRRALKGWWVESPERWVAWLMLNPSTANSSRNDSTTRNLTHFTRNWTDGGPYDGWIAVNCIPSFLPSWSRRGKGRIGNRTGRIWLRETTSKITLAIFPKPQGWRRDGWLRSAHSRSITMRIG